MKDRINKTCDIIWMCLLNGRSPTTEPGTAKWSGRAPEKGQTANGLEWGYKGSETWLRKRYRWKLGEGSS
jgi:hypothetical protein